MGNFGFGGYPSNQAYGGYGDSCGCKPQYPVGGVSCGNSFALIVVLFILLIIVGAAFVC
ncbi:YjcZ family sporulation protein [Sporolactobacillus sp. Y61]|jgi:uncharacterized protein (TIGR01732 family)|uniref:YjcZ family sporulation protein n=1 Tax=Sporolactobacillus sp. Y61 TaxID=3160863 RepID=A0AAU8ICH6_9BACL|nr:YjcZ family sporulation protein [Sporolactobacillus sp. THM19-2]RYL90293.1 YjcZ family sporulation protein [Sporolactobacillus sp. THM19-2]